MSLLFLNFMMEKLVTIHALKLAEFIAVNCI